MAQTSFGVSPNASLSRGSCIGNLVYRDAEPHPLTRGSPLFPEFLPAWQPVSRGAWWRTFACRPQGGNFPAPLRLGQGCILLALEQAYFSSHCKFRPAFRRSLNVDIAGFLSLPDLWLSGKAFWIIPPGISTSSPRGTARHRLEYSANSFPYFAK